MSLRRISRKFIILILAFILITAGLLHSVIQNFFSEKKTNPDTARIIMENVTMIQLGADGKPADQLITSHLTNFERDNTSYLTKPHFTFYSPPGPPWEITSDSGRATNGTDIIYLWQNVVMHQPASQTRPPSTLTTDHFTVFPVKKEGNTDAPVKLVQPGIIVTAVGAKANLADKHITLLSQVKAVFNRQSTQGNSQ